MEMVAMVSETGERVYLLVALVVLLFNFVRRAVSVKPVKRIYCQTFDLCGKNARPLLQRLITRMRFDDDRHY
jgi:hypothetical protein